MENYNYPGWENIFVGDLVIVKKQLLFRVFKVAYKHDNFIGMDVLYDYEDSSKVGNIVSWRKDLFNDENVFIFPHNTLIIINNIAVDFNGVRDKSKHPEIANLYGDIRKFTQAYTIMPIEIELHYKNIKSLCSNVTSAIEIGLSLSSTDDIVYYNMILDKFISVRSIFNKFNDLYNSLSED